METPRGEVHIDSDEARAGSTPNVVRYVLLISFLLAAVALGIIVISGSMRSNHNNNAVDDSARAAAEQKVQESH